MVEPIVVSSIQFKRGTTAALNAWTEIPQIGEPVYDLDLKRLKIGDGIHLYKDLPYLGGSGSDQLVFSSRYEFPSVGKVDMLYIATDENNSYIWKNDQVGGHYEILSVDGREIDGGDASAVY